MLQEYIEVINKFGFQFSEFDKLTGTGEFSTYKLEELIERTIDELVSKLENNKETNGFFSSDDVVKIDSTNGFKIDDKEIYYLFFETVREGFQKTGELSLGIVYRAIRYTLTRYFGKPLDNWQVLRMEFTTPDLDNDWEYPSISKQRKRGSAVCVEQASVSHNLWLLCGVKSYYIQSKDVKTDLGEGDDGHSFCVVEYNGTFRLFDTTLGVFEVLDYDPIELMRKGEPFEIETDGKRTIYTNASKPLNI